MLGLSRLNAFASDDQEFVVFVEDCVRDFGVVPLDVLGEGIRRRFPTAFAHQQHELAALGATAVVPPSAR